MKFCNNCGNQMDDAAAFCNNCGAASVPVAPAAPAAPAAKKASANEFVGKAAAVAEGFVKDAKKDPKKLIVPGAIVLGAIVLIVILCMIFGGGPESAIDTYIDVVYEGKANKIEKTMPKEAWEYLEDEYDIELDELKEDYEDNYEDFLDEMEDEFGKNVKVTYKVTDKDKLSKKKLEDYAEEVEDNWDIDEKKVTDGYKLDLEFEIKGKDDDDDWEVEDVVILKVNGSWYIVEGLSLDF